MNDNSAWSAPSDAGQAPQVTQRVECWNLHDDGWLESESALLIHGMDEIKLSFFLPEGEGVPQTKLIALFDGGALTHITLRRGASVASPAIRGHNGVIKLQIYAEYSEVRQRGDVRNLGAVMSFRTPELDPTVVQRLKGRRCPARFTMVHPEAGVVSHRFDAEYYRKGFDQSDIPSNPLLHYLLIGWKTGREPNSSFSTLSFCESQNFNPGSDLTPFAQFCLQNEQAKEVVARTKYDEDTEVAKWTGSDALDLDLFWRDFAGAELLEEHPDFRFDSRFYGQLYRDVHSLPALVHFEEHGRREGRHPNRYSVFRSRDGSADKRILALLRNPLLVDAITRGQPHAAELAFELMALGSPIDQTISDFSARYYIDIYADIGNSGIDPLLHYLSHGIGEGRRNIKQLRQKMTLGQISFDPDKPTCLICSHEFSRTGAPVVALNLAREAAATHNVVVASLRDGPLAEDFRKTSTVVIVTETPFEDMRYLDHEAISAISFAILNSVESFEFGKVLVSRGIPYSSYIHEYTEYTLPAYKTKFTCLFADCIIYSAEQVRASWRGVFADVGFDVDRDSLILAQEQLPVPKITKKDYDAARGVMSRVLGTDLKGRRLIYGAGQVQIRKGTDIFIMAAQQAKDRDPEAVFVWIGDGQNHEDIVFGTWLDYHLREVGVNDPQGNLFFIPAGPYYIDLCKASDEMFLASRLDPLPNVVFDAVRFGARVVMFQNATGFSDQRYLDSKLLQSVPYGDVSAACDRLMEAPLKSDRMRSLRGAKAPDGTATPEHTTFDVIRLHLERRLAERPKAKVEPGTYDVPIMFGSGADNADLRNMERIKIRASERRMVWKSREEVEDAIASGSNWMHERSRIVQRTRVPVADLSANLIPAFGIHIHAFYTDGLAEDFRHFAAYQRAKRIVCTTDSKTKASQICDLGAAAGLEIEARVVPNRGRDILPFIELVASQTELEDDFIWCHLHQKKSIGSASTGDAWRKFLMNVLLGDDQSVSSALIEIGARDSGLVAALDPYIVGWEASYRLLPSLSTKIGRPLPPHPLIFPVGNMFWVRTAVVRRMHELFGADYPWPNEPIPNDGTIYHAIERLWPGVSMLSGMDSVFLDAPDVLRV